MIVTEAATLAHIEPFWSWNTPIAWTGFILFADGVVSRARGDSWIVSAPREFICLALVSIPLWLVFEFYNRFIENWYYVGLPDNLALRYFGYAWSFATVWPAIFEAAELFAVWRGRNARLKSRGTNPWSITAARGFSRPIPFSRASWVSMIAGAAMLLWPLIWPSPLLAAPVFLGFTFLLDPINARLGADSLCGDLAARRHDRLFNLAASGFLCGVLWELWNYWARSKWHYAVPILERIKIFEMPVPGYLGFPAFAVECFTMYVFVRAIAGKLGRTIAL